MSLWFHELASLFLYWYLLDLIFLRFRSKYNLFTMINDLFGCYWLLIVLDHLFLIDLFINLFILVELLKFLLFF
jgi:hypothetical protein